MKYAEIINQALDDSSSKEKRDLLVDSTLQFYQNMKAKMASGDPLKQQEAMKEISEIQALLIERRNEICKKTGLSPAQITMLGKHPMFAKDRAELEERAAKLIELLKPSPEKKRLKRRIPV